MFYIVLGRRNAQWLPVLLSREFCAVQAAEVCKSPSRCQCKNPQYWIETLLVNDKDEVRWDEWQGAVLLRCRNGNEWCLSVWALRSRIDAHHMICEVATDYTDANLLVLMKRFRCKRLIIILEGSLYNEDPWNLRPRLVRKSIDYLWSIQVKNPGSEQRWLD